MDGVAPRAMLKRSFGGMTGRRLVEPGDRAVAASVPVVCAVFNRAVSSGPARDYRLLKTSRNFGRSSTSAAIVGRNRGLLLAGLLDAYPELHGVLFDPPGVVDGTATLLCERISRGCCRIEDGDLRL